MNRALSALAVCTALAALAIPAFAVAGGGNEISVEPVRGKAVGHGDRLWVFVSEAKSGKPSPSPTPSICTDGDQSDYKLFGKARLAGLTFNLNRTSIPGDETAKVAAITALQNALDAWDAVVPQSYFTLNQSGGAAAPAKDGNNTIGWTRINPKNALAVTYTWTDSSGRISEADVFFNNYYSWAAFTSCQAQNRYEIGNVGAHELGHAVGVDHTSDANRFATLYPSGSAGEVRKQTLTAGDAAGFVASLN